MAEQTFRSPGFFEREIDVSLRKQPPVGIPAGVIAAAQRGPAFVPVIVGDFRDFETRFGSLDPKFFGPYAVQEFLKNQTACTFMRVLGCGANTTFANIQDTIALGTVRNAGFRITGSGGPQSAAATTAGEPPAADWHPRGVVQFLCARHFVSASLFGGGGEPTAFPVFSDNQSFPGTEGGDDTINLVRAILFTATGTIFQALDYNVPYHASRVPDPGTANHVSTGDDAMCTDSVSGQMPAFTFKLVLSNSDGAEFGGADDQTGLKIYTASLDPRSPFYITNFLNTDPLKFEEKKHLLYVDFPVDSLLAQLSIDNQSILLCSGAMNTSDSSGDTTLPYLGAFGRFDTRYTTPRTTHFISQPYAQKEYDLFYFETLSDGAYANDKFKISIANLKPSMDKGYPYPSFEVQVREFDDTDFDPQIIERYLDCNLDPNSDRFLGRVIGDTKVFFNFDAELEAERRLIINGKYPNVSSLVRVQISAPLYAGEVPKDAMPFGFRGIPTLKTNNTLTDLWDTVIPDLGSITHTNSARLQSVTSSLPTDSQATSGLTGSIVPPLPYTWKCTRGEASTTANFAGQQGTDERADSRIYWGVHNTLLPISSSASPTGLANALFRTNEGNKLNRIVNAYTKFMGIQKLDTLVTGAGADAFNSNKFTLARVALPIGLDGAGHITDVTGSAADTIKSTAYIRNGRLSSAKYTLTNLTEADFTNGRITLATLLNSSSAHFNRFGGFAKYTNIFYGGFDGLNILDRDQFLMNDKATSTVAAGGKANADYGDTTSTSCLGVQANATRNPAGAGINNSVIIAYKQASSIITDHLTSNANIVAIPGIRDPLVTDFVGQNAKENGQVFYVMDLEPYDENGNRVYASDGNYSDVTDTALQFELRNIDNNYVGTYFPDVWVRDDVNNSVAKVPASVAALSALGLNDKVARPWFAPAGFSRGSLGFVTNVDIRLSAADRDTLYDARINPIATFPNVGFVIFGQKNLQASQTALDRINVRRMLIEVKRLVFNVARGILFDQNTPATRAKFLSQAVPLLALVQAQQGIEQFKVIMDDSNNSAQDFDDYRLNGRIIVIPTRAIEYIAIDFIITQTGVSFE